MKNEETQPNGRRRQEPFFMGYSSLVLCLALLLTFPTPTISSSSYQPYNYPQKSSCTNKKQNISQHDSLQSQQRFHGFHHSKRRIIDHHYRSRNAFSFVIQRKVNKYHHEGSHLKSRHFSSYVLHACPDPSYMVGKELIHDIIEVSSPVEMSNPSILHRSTFLHGLATSFVYPFSSLFPLSDPDSDNSNTLSSLSSSSSAVILATTTSTTQIQDAIEIIQTQRIALDNIVEVISNQGNFNEAGFKMKQLTSQIRMGGTIILNELQTTTIPSSSSSSNQKNKNNDGIDTLRILQCSRKFNILLETCEDCTIQIENAMKVFSKNGVTGTAGVGTTMISAQLQLLDKNVKNKNKYSSLMDVKYAFDDFLLDLDGLL